MKKYIVVLVLFVWGSSTVFAAPAVYQVDATHSSVMFSVDYLVISKTTGKFSEFSGQVTWDEADLAQSKIEGSINAASVDTDNDKRDDHLRGEDFFWIEKYPQIQFVTTKIIKDGENYKATGNLTLRGVTKPVEVPFKITGRIKDFSGNERVGFSGSFVINRKDYGINWSKALDSGGAVVSDAVTVQLDVQAVQKSSP